jgi:hypothetical protein
LLKFKEEFNMNKFARICKMKQPEVKAYMKKYLTSKGYKTICEDGFLYAKGTVPVLLIAHMDTVHKETCTEILVDKTKTLSSPQGIGGDDRSGIYIISEIVKELNCSVLLCEDEEIGGIGASKFTKTKYIDDLGVNYMIEFDRKGNNDAVFYSCDNKDFTKFITETTGFKEAFGSFSDISTVAPAAKIAAVNLSCGYYSAHTASEYVKFNEMLNTIEVAKKLIKTESSKFEYVAKKYPNYNYGGYRYGGYYDGYYDDWWGYGSKGNSKQTKFNDVCKSEFDLELEVVFTDPYGEEAFDYIQGSTKAECWARFFMNNPDVCFAMITDYNFI